MTLKEKLNKLKEVVIKHKAEITKQTVKALKLVFTKDISKLELFVTINVNGTIKTYMNEPKVDDNTIVCVHFTSKQLQSILNKFKDIVSSRCSYTKEAGQELIKEYLLEVIDESICNCLYENGGPTELDELFFEIDQIQF